MVNKIEYEGKEYPIKIDFNTIEKVCTKFNIKFREFDNVPDNPEQFKYLFKESLIRGHKLDGKVFKLKDEEIDEILADNFAEFTIFYGEGVRALFVPKSQRPSEDDKKK